MDKKAKNYRFSQKTLEILEELTDMLSITETEAISRALAFYLQFLKNENEVLKQKNVVSLKEYQDLQKELSKILYRLGELEGENKEKQIQLEDKSKQIENLQAIINRLLDQKENNTKKWWQFW